MPERKEDLKGFTRRLPMGCGRNLYTTLNFDDDSKPYEMLLAMGNADGCVNSMLEGTGRLISLYLRSGKDPEMLASELRMIQCPSPGVDAGNKMLLSCMDGAARVLSGRREYENKRTKEESKYGATARAATHCGNLYTTLGFDNGDWPDRIKLAVGKNTFGGCVMSMLDGAERVITMCLQSGLDPDSIAKEIRDVKCGSSVRCSSSTGGGGEIISSCLDGASHVLDRYGDFKETIEQQRRDAESKKTG